jgi:hypothetical protein
MDGIGRRISGRIKELRKTDLESIGTDLESIESAGLLTAVSRVRGQRPRALLVHQERITN